MTPLKAFLGVTTAVSASSYTVHKQALWNSSLKAGAMVASCHTTIEQEVPKCASFV